MSKYMLIGGAGVFGIHTAAHFLSKSETTRVVSVGRNIQRGPSYTLDVGKNDPRYEYVQIHITFETERLIELIDKEKPDFIINFAAIAYATSWEKSFRYYDTNLMSVVRLCEALESRDFLKKFLQIGTSELYGSVNHPVKEDAPLNPTSPYAVSKLAADLHLLTLQNADRLPINILRPSNAYGPGQQIWRLIPRLVYCCLTGEKMPLQGGGSVRKSYLHTKDLTEAIDLVCHKAPCGEIYNVGPDEPISIRNVVEIIIDKFGLKLEDVCDIVAPRKFEDTTYWLDSTKIKQLGWEQQVNIEDGLQDMIEWGKSYVDLLHEENQNFVLHA